MSTINRTPQGPLIAAGNNAIDAISKSIMEASALRVPQERMPLTPEQAAAWEQLAATFGEERFALEWCSYREAAEAGIKAMQDEADTMLENPAVRRAWDRFMLVWQLTKENNKSE